MINGFYNILAQIFIYGKSIIFYYIWMNFIFYDEKLYLWFSLSMSPSFFRQQPHVSSSASGSPTVSP